MIVGDGVLDTWDPNNGTVDEGSAITLTFKVATAKPPTY